MINFNLVTVKLLASGRDFRCAYCGALCQHPPTDLMQYIIGHGYCERCVCWIPIQGGDKLGIARVLKRQPVEQDAHAMEVIQK